jgi:dTDP-4-dehydrorhamnose reductase
MFLIKERRLKMSQPLKNKYMNKLIILGGKGNLGKQIERIFKDNYEIVAWDKEEVDIGDKELIINKISSIKPDIIINAAAYNAVDKCEEEDGFLLAKNLNGEAVAYLSEAALKNNAVLVHFSSDYVFDGLKKNGYGEADKTKPVNKYGKSKEMGEKEIISRSGKGLKWYLIRTSKLFGPKGESDVSKESFFDLMLRLEKEKDSFNLVHQEEISCFTYMPDLAVETEKLISEKFPYGIYHIVNSEPASWYEGAKYLFELKGLDIKKLKPVGSKDYPRPAKRPEYSILLNTKLPPLRSWKEALKDYLNI